MGAQGCYILTGSAESKKGKNMNKIRMLVVIFSAIALGGCAMHFVKSDYRVSCEDYGLSPRAFPKVLVIPFVQSKLICGINMGFQTTIYDRCAEQLQAKGFKVVNCSPLYGFLRENQIKITNKIDRALDTENLLIEVLQSGDTIPKIGAAMNVDCIVANRILVNSGAFWGKQYVCMETLVFDAKDSKILWRAWADVTHGSGGAYKEKIFEKIFTKIFANVKKE
jgi:hypothetical protein